MVLKVVYGLYPPKGAVIAEPEWGPIDFTYVLIILSCVLETYLGVSKWEILVKSGLLVYFLLKKMIRDICTKGRAQHLTDLLMYFWSNKKTKNMTKKCDISRRKFKNIESPKMVSKRFYGHYLRSYEQF